MATITPAVGSSTGGGTAAGGVLSGTYPNPGFAVDMATQAELNALTAAAVTSSTIDQVVTLTQAAYDALSSKPSTVLYVITG